MEISIILKTNKSLADMVFGQVFRVVSTDCGSVKICKLVEEVILMKEWQGVNSLFSRLGMALFFVTGRTICMAQVINISSAELMQRIKANHAGLILDVRSPQEYAEGHIPGAINIPHNQLGSRLAEIGSYKGKDVVLYCKSGWCASIAANTLQAAGFGKLLHLDGDMNGWLSNVDLPIKKLQDC